MYDHPSSRDGLLGPNIANAQMWMRPCRTSTPWKAENSAGQCAWMVNVAVCCVSA